MTRHAARPLKNGHTTSGSRVALPLPASSDTGRFPLPRDRTRPSDGAVRKGRARDNPSKAIRIMTRRLFLVATCYELPGGLSWRRTAAKFGGIRFRERGLPSPCEPTLRQFAPHLLGAAQHLWLPDPCKLGADLAG